jgi:hypothetical protein
MISLPRIKRPPSLCDFVSVDFAADLDTRRSHTGYVVMMNSGAGLSAGSQKSVSLSTAESEWYAASEVLIQTYIQDSHAVIAMTENPSNRKGARHIDAREHFVDQLVKDSIIKLVQ